MKSVMIGDRKVGDGAPVYVIAEAGSNHDRDLDQARRLIDVAAAAGADAVKFQTFTASRIVAETKTRAKYLDAILPPDKTMSDLFAELELPHEWHAALYRHAVDAGDVRGRAPECVDLFHRGSSASQSSCRRVLLVLARRRRSAHQ